MLRCGLYFVQYRAAGHPISLLFRNMQVGDISVEEISRTMNLSVILLQSGSNVLAHCWEDWVRPIILVVCRCIFCLYPKAAYSAYWEVGYSITVNTWVWRPRLLVLMMLYPLRGHHQSLKGLCTGASPSPVRLSMQYIAMGPTSRTANNKIHYPSHWLTEKMSTFRAL